VVVVVVVARRIPRLLGCHDRHLPSPLNSSYAYCTGKKRSICNWSFPAFSKLLNNKTLAEGLRAIDGTLLVVGGA